MDDPRFNERRASEGAPAAYVAIAAALALTLIALIVTLLWPSSAEAHDWYDAVCCSDEDCAPVRAATVRATPDGWEVTLAPGDHPMVQEPLRHVYPYDSPRVRPSRDQDFHACVSVHGQRMLCLYVPVFGS